MSSCATGTDAVCSECEAGHYSFRHDEDSTRCIPACSVNMVGAGLAAGSTGIFSFVVPADTTLQTGTLAIGENRPQPLILLDRASHILARTAERPPIRQTCDFLRFPAVPEIQCGCAVCRWRGGERAGR